MAIARALAADPWGRFGGREGKMARIARMEREAAARAGSALNATLGEKGGKEQEEEGKEEEDKSAAPSKQKQKEKTKREKESNEAAASEATKKTVAVPPPPLAAAPEAPATPLYTPPAGWWGNSFFVHAGRLEGISDSKEKEKGEARGFTDADQEALAERTTALKAAGKRGLGAASLKKKEKAVGHEWKGSKVVFGDGEGEDDCEDDGGADNKRERKKQKKEMKEKKEKKSKEDPPSPPLDVSSLKWKKAAEAALSQGGSGGAKAMKKGLSVSELAAQVAAALSAKASASKGDLEAALGRSLRSLCESSSRFEVDGKGRVKLAAAKKK